MIRALKHHATNGFGKGGVTGAVQHDLRHGAFAGGIVARFVPFGGGQAIGGVGEEAIDERSNAPAWRGRLSDHAGRFGKV